MVNPSEFITSGLLSSAMAAAPPGSGAGGPWDGARLLAAFLSSPTGVALLRGCAVLELGAGSHGLPSCIAAAVCGARCAIATDRAAMLPALAASLHAFQNGGGGGCGAPLLPLHAAALEFGGNLKRALGPAWGAPGAVDWLLLSELLSLSPALFPALLKTVRDAAPRRGVLLAFRPREGFEGRFLEALAAEGFSAKEVRRGVHGKGGFVCTEAGLEGCDAVVVLAERGDGA